MDGGVEGLVGELLELSVPSFLVQGKSKGVLGWEACRREGGLIRSGCGGPTLITEKKKRTEKEVLHINIRQENRRTVSLLGPCLLRGKGNLTW